jgi:hypothetical protein
VNISNDIHLERKFLDFFFVAKKTMFPNSQNGFSGPSAGGGGSGGLNSSTRCQCFKLFAVVIYGFSLQARVFVPGKPLEPSLMFADKDGAYLRVECLEDAPL